MQYVNLMVSGKQVRTHWYNITALVSIHCAKFGWDT